MSCSITSSIHRSARLQTPTSTLVTAGIALLQARREVREVTEDRLLAGPVDLQEHAEFQSASCHGAGEGDRRVGEHQPVLALEERDEEGTPLGARAVVQIRDEHGVTGDLRTAAQNLIVDLSHEVRHSLLGCRVTDELL